MQQAEANPLGSLGAAVDAVAQALASGRVGPGERAELRRVHLESVPGPAYWHVMARLVEPRHPAPEGEFGRTRWERRWATVLCGMALLAHAPHRPPGRALAEVGFHELRLRRLLRASHERLGDELLGAARYLASKGEALDWREAARLVHHDPHDAPEWAEKVRRRVARDYFGTVTANEGGEQ